VVLDSHESQLNRNRICNGLRAAKQGQGSRGIREKIWIPDDSQSQQRRRHDPMIELL